MSSDPSYSVTLRLAWAFASTRHVAAATPSVWGSVWKTTVRGPISKPPEGGQRKGVGGVVGKIEATLYRKGSLLGIGQAGFTRPA